MNNQAPTHIVAFKMVDAPEAGRGWIAYKCLCGFTTEPTLPGTNASINAQAAAKRTHWDEAYGTPDNRLGRSIADLDREADAMKAAALAADKPKRGEPYSFKWGR